MPRPDFIDPAKEAAAVKALLESIAAVDADDEQLVLDMIEGETRFLDLIDALLLRRAESLGHVEGLDAAIANLEARKARFKARAESAKALIEQALTLAELPKLERPAATLTMSARAPSLIVTEESAVPARFWRTPDPVLDKKALIAALRERRKAIESLPEDPEARAAALAAIPEDIPGVELSNAAPTLTIRSA